LKIQIKTVMDKRPIGYIPGKGNVNINLVILFSH